MRNAFVKELENIMKDSNTFLLTGDLGYSVFEKIREKFERQYLNMGVAEQNMIGVAAGMALTGKHVFVYSIIPFLIYRPFEQIRNDICFQNLPVRLVGVGAGFSYSDAGFTHHAVEDYGILRSMPNLTILSPADPLEVSMQMTQMNKVDGPLYMRLGRNGDPIIHDQHKYLKIGKALVVSRGKDLLFVTTGSILAKVFNISKVLEENGISVEILDYHTIKPFDEETLIKHSRSKKLIVTFEEHLVSTGLYSLVTQSLMKNNLHVKSIPFGVNEPITHLSGTREYMLSQYGMSEQNIYNNIREKLVDEI